ncbi:MAG: hypothetical protein PWQ31_506 [Eubacteriales bacterium]|nr:hypothetical protein [Eubacteriales bacterium]
MVFLHGKKARPAWRQDLLFAGLASIPLLLLLFLPHLAKVKIASSLFLAFHNVVEISSIVIAFTVVISAWFNYRETGSLFSLLIALTFTGAGFLDLIHTLSYPGMPPFLTPSSPNKASTFWISARLWEAAFFLLAVLLQQKKVRREIPLVVFLLPVLSFLPLSSAAVIYWLDHLPPMYVASYGQSPVKKGLEFVVISLRALALFSIYRYQKEAEEKEAPSLFLRWSLLAGILSETAFSVYASVYDLLNIAGHLYKITAYLLVLYALFITSLQRMYKINRLLKLQKEKMEEVNRRLRETNRLQREFLAHTNHELRTPLTGIIAFAEMLKDPQTGPLAPLQEDFVNEILNSSSRLLNMINSLLDMAKIEAGMMNLNRKACRPEEIVSAALRAVHPLLQHKNQQVNLLLPPKLPSILADPERAEQILTNLLNNASKYSPPDSTITIAVDVIRVPEPTLRFAVTDQGPGLSEEERRYIFERFRRGRAAKNAAGTGLGLSLARTLVEMHGGRMWVESSPGQGSTFFFTLPVATAATEAAASGKEEKSDGKS